MDCGEALYVGTLTVKAGAKVTLSKSKVYYGSASIDPTATVITDGCGALVEGPSGPPPLESDPFGTQMVRFVSFVVPGESSGQTALRVRLDTLHDPLEPPTTGTPPDFSALEGTYRYVNSFGGSIHCIDSQTVGTGYFCGQLGCQPEYRDWAAELSLDEPGYPPIPGLIHVTGDAVAPDSILGVSHIAASCGAAPAADGCASASAELLLATARLGDVASADNGPPDGSVSVVDLNLVKTKLILDTVQEQRTWLRDKDPDPGTGAINVLDLGFVIDALKGSAYPADQDAMTGFYIDACP